MDGSHCILLKWWSLHFGGSIRFQLQFHVRIFDMWWSLPYDWYDGMAVQPMPCRAMRGCAWCLQCARSCTAQRHLASSKCATKVHWNDGVWAPCSAISLGQRAADTPVAVHTPGGPQNMTQVQRELRCWRCQTTWHTVERAELPREARGSAASRSTPPVLHVQRELRYVDGTAKTMQQWWSYISSNVKVYVPKSFSVPLLGTFSPLFVESYLCGWLPLRKPALVEPAL